MKVLEKKLLIVFLLNLFFRLKIKGQRGGGLIGITKNFETQKIPGGWLWEDIGNYYGAGCGSLNWNENQFDLMLKPGNHINDTVKVIGTNPKLTNDFLNEIITKGKETGDNGNIYFSPNSDNYEIRGSIPCCVDTFTISGAVSDNDYYTLSHFASVLQNNNFTLEEWSSLIAINPPTK